MSGRWTRDAFCRARRCALGFHPFAQRPPSRQVGSARTCRGYKAIRLLNGSHHTRRVVPNAYSALCPPVPAAEISNLTLWDRSHLSDCYLQNCLNSAARISARFVWRQRLLRLLRLPERRCSAAAAFRARTRAAGSGTGHSPGKFSVRIPNRPPGSVGERAGNSCPPTTKPLADISQCARPRCRWWRHGV